MDVAPPRRVHTDGRSDDPLRSWHRPEHPYLGRLPRRCRHGEEEAVQVRAEQGSPRAPSRRHMGHTAISAALCRKHIEETVPTTDVDAVPLRIDEYIVGVTAGFEARCGGTLAHREHTDA